MSLKMQHIVQRFDDGTKHFSANLFIDGEVWLLRALCFKCVMKVRPMPGQIEKYGNCERDMVSIDSIHILRPFVTNRLHKYEMVRVEGSIWTP